eukprot:CAMPEP_0178962956 /NCGR_PEP_ID=MMETSP0789-20121207/14706_1 /TAXON_ID=3005 /ORGANISM="Rhizosolenia setigera, Strain CCMP 1694" /LENGTH=847 /DNA_ID=CAMNT_0020647271 /DNA_START=99 /DNA_END=2642 /DNA_ORIENTATION=-
MNVLSTSMGEEQQALFTEMFKEKYSDALESFGSILLAAEEDTTNNNNVKDAAPSSSSSSLRGGKNNKFSNPEDFYEGRMGSLMRRVHGAENVHVHEFVHKIATESTEYVRTGISQDPSFKVSYRNHPYAIYEENERKKSRALSGENNENEETKRELHDFEYKQQQDGSGGADGFDLDGEEEIDDAFQNIRITVVVDALEKMRSAANSAQMDFVKEKVLPATVDFWTNTLRVVPVEGNLKLNKYDLQQQQYCGDPDFSTVPPTHISEGIPDTDLVLYVSASASPKFCGPSTLAVAVGCNSDQYDRPIAGAINFCVDTIKLDEDGQASESVLSDNVDVAIHETAHILGMSSNSYKFFRNSETGKALTRRPFQFTPTLCVTGKTRNERLPDENTLKFLDHTDGTRYALITTPKVKTVVRNQFNCQEMEGAPLENQPTGAYSCTGDHWEESLFYPESMGAVISTSQNLVTPLTLALLEDSGWYSANYSMSSLSPWGHGVGCDFVNKKCIETSADGEVTVADHGKGYFCSETNQRGCSPSYSHKLSCTIYDYSLLFNLDNPPPEYNYFSNPGYGGPKQANYCPVYGSVYGGMKAEELECGIASNVDTVNIFGEYYGENSKCFETNTGEGRCYKAQCLRKERVLKVYLKDKWVTCEEDFQEITFSSLTGAFGGSITCPKLSSICPDLFCPANCAGRGICDYDNVVNGTVSPACKCFDETDTSPGCSESLVLDGSYLEDSSFLEGVLTETGLEDLYAIWKDDPTAWNKTTWAWAGALLAFFGLLMFCICASFWPSSRKKVLVKKKRHRKRTKMSKAHQNYRDQRRRRKHDRRDGSSSGGGSSHHSPHRRRHRKK